MKRAEVAVTSGHFGALEQRVERLEQRVNAVVDRHLDSQFALVMVLQIATLAIVLISGTIVSISILAQR